MAAEDQDVAMADAPPPAPEVLVLPMVDERLLEDVKSMGFPELRARKALMAGSKNVETALDWLLNHEGDSNIDEAITLVPKGRTATGPVAVAKSIKCVETGRLFWTPAEAQFYAEKTGRTQFEETTEEKKPLTEEKKKQKIIELKALAAKRRAEREEVEKVQDVDAEKKRREQGQESIKTKEQLEKVKRLREIDSIKREKDAKKSERERLRAEIAKDKAERRARGGKLAGKLGVDGYAPSIDQNDSRRNDGVPEEEAEAPKIKIAKKDLTPVEQVDKAISTIQKYKAAGDGGTCLKTLGAYLQNALTKGDQDVKFRKIPLDNAAFKKRVSGLVGGIALLRAVGFTKDDKHLELTLAARDANRALLEATLVKLGAAHTAYCAGAC